MKYVSTALLAVIAICAVISTYDHFYGGTYAWVSQSGAVIDTGYSYSKCQLVKTTTSRCVREK